MQQRSWASPFEVCSSGTCLERERSGGLYLGQGPCYQPSNIAGYRPKVSKSNGFVSEPVSVMRFLALALHDIRQIK